MQLLQHSVHTYKGVRDASFQAATLALKRYPCMTVSCLPFLLSGLANLPRPSADALLASLNGSVADGECSDSCSDTAYTTLVGNVITLAWSVRLAQAYNYLPGVSTAAAHLAVGKILALLQLCSRAGGRPLEVLGGTLHKILSVVLSQVRGLWRRHWPLCSAGRWTAALPVTSTHQLQVILGVIALTWPKRWSSQLSKILKEMLKRVAVAL